MESSFENFDELEAMAKENGYEEGDIKRLKSEVYHGHYKYEWQDRNWFFTYSGYDEHVRLNKHNYGKIRNFVSYCNRNPEMETVQRYLKDLV